MNDPPRRIILSYTLEFKRNVRHLAKKYPHLRADLQPLIDALTEGKREGDKIPGVRFDVYKARVRNSDAQRGKSGGYRVIWYFRNQTQIVLVTIYSKSEQGDVAAK